MSLDLGKVAKNNFERFFFKFFNNATFGKTMGNVRKHRHQSTRDIVTTEGRGNYLVSEGNYHTTKFFTEYFVAIKMKKGRYL